MKTLVVETDLVDVQNVVDQLRHLLLGCDLPLARCVVPRQPGEAEDGHPVLLRLVDHPVLELGIGGDLNVVRDRQLVMTTLKKDQPIIMVSNRLLNMHQLGVGILGGKGESSLGQVEDMKDIVKT